MQISRRGRLIRSDEAWAPPSLPDLTWGESRLRPHGCPHGHPPAARSLNPPT